MPSSRSSSKEGACSRSHARNSERGAAAQRACRLASEVVAKYGKPVRDSELSRGRPADRTARVWRRAPLLGPPPWPPMV